METAQLDTILRSIPAMLILYTNFPETWFYPSRFPLDVLGKYLLQSHDISHFYGALDW